MYWTIAFHPLLSRQCFSWCKVNYVSVSFPFCGCCLTQSTKLNTRSGCPLYNLASNSKVFPESLAKLLGMIFLYFGTLLTCCRYLFSFFFKWCYHTQCALLWTICQTSVVTGLSVWVTWMLHLWFILSILQSKPVFLLSLSGHLLKRHISSVLVCYRSKLSIHLTWHIVKRKKKYCEYCWWVGCGNKI